MDKYQAGINEYLQKFGARFEIDRIRTSFSGGKPSSTYCISINDINIDMDNDGVNALSEGDKNALAFAFFLIKLDLDPNLKDKTVVFDDPMTSLDGFRKTCTEQQIIRYIDNTNQIIVLSHDLQFLKSIRDGVKGIPVSTLCITASEKNSIISKWDIEKATQSEYYLTYMKLSDFINERSKEDLLSIASCIRPILEWNLRMRFIDKIPSNIMLGQMIQMIRDSDDDSLLEIKPLLNEIIEINEYAKRFHHQNPSINSTRIDERELKNYAKRTLRFTRGITIVGDN